ncbi:MAG: hypothetical protein K2Y27_25020 [Xanthobacteraceae bacterium]|nr:hypothetical protein [Xanthobacteraceae bacterium]
MLQARFATSAIGAGYVADGGDGEAALDGAGFARGSGTSLAKTPSQAASNKTTMGGSFIASSPKGRAMPV